MRFKNIVLSVGTSASIISLAFITLFPTWLRLLIMIMGIVSFGILIYDDIKNRTENEKICRSEAEIKNTMQELIKTPGKVCIMSRDLSWVDEAMEKCIVDKKNSISIFAEKENELTKRLAQKGVKLKYYGHLNFEPKSRFTVIRYNRDDPQVAIANTKYSIRRRQKVKHVIYETGGDEYKQDKWITSLAIDMITLCDRVSKEG